MPGTPMPGRPHLDAGHGHSPVNSGGRRSAIAATPSRQSSVAVSRSCSARSRASAARTSSARSPRIVSRIERTASGAEPAISAASASAAARSSSAGDEPVGDARAQRLLAADAAARCRAGRAAVWWPTTRGSVTRQAEAVVEPEAGEVGGEAGLGGGDPEVGGHRQAEPAADRRALHGGDDRQRLREQPDRHRRRGAAPPAAGARARRRSRRRRRSACPRWPARRRGSRRRPSYSRASARSRDQRDVEEVVRRAADLDDGDVPVDLDPDVVSSPGHAARSTPQRGSASSRGRLGP